jgi:hypothetical protein
VKTNKDSDRRREVMYIAQYCIIDRINSNKHCIFIILLLMILEFYMDILQTQNRLSRRYIAEMAGNVMAARHCSVCTSGMWRGAKVLKLAESLQFAGK